MSPQPLERAAYSYPDMTERIDQTLTISPTGEITFHQQDYADVIAADEPIVYLQDEFKVEPTDTEDKS